MVNILTRQVRECEYSVCIANRVEILTQFVTQCRDEKKTEERNEETKKVRAEMEETYNAKGAQDSSFTVHYIF